MPELAAAKERQRFVEARVSMLRTRVSQIQLMNLERIPHDKAGFGSKLTLREGSRTFVYELVMPEDANPDRGLVSVASPVGRSLVGKGVRRRGRGADARRAAVVRNRQAGHRARRRVLRHRDRAGVFAPAPHGCAARRKRHGRGVSGGRAPRHHRSRRQDRCHRRARRRRVDRAGHGRRRRQPRLGLGGSLGADPRLRWAYRWRPALRAAFLAFLASMLLLLSPLIVLVLAGATYLCYPDRARQPDRHGCVAGGCLSADPRTAVESALLPTLLPRAMVLAMLLIATILAVPAWYAIRRERSRRRVTGTFWWQLSSPLDATEPGATCLETLWHLVRGASSDTRPQAAEVGRRYIDVLSDNFGQPGVSTKSWSPFTISMPGVTWWPPCWRRPLAPSSRIGMPIAPHGRPIWST